MDEQQRIDACLRLGLPRTGNPELDRLILDKVRFDLSARFMAAFIEQGMTADTAAYESAAAAYCLLKQFNHLKDG